MPYVGRPWQALRLAQRTRHSSRSCRIEEVGRVLRISERGVYRLLRSGELACLKVGQRTLVEPDEVRQFIANRQAAGRRPERGGRACRSPRAVVLLSGGLDSSTDARRSHRTKASSHMRCRSSTGSGTTSSSRRRDASLAALAFASTSKRRSTCACSADRR